MLVDVDNGDLEEHFKEILVFIKTEYGTCFLRTFSQNIHLKGCQRCNTPLGHAHRRRQWQPDGALQVDISLIKTAYFTFKRVFSQGIILKGCQRCSTFVGHARRRRQR